MYKLSRLMLILSVVAGLWSLLIFGMQLGGLGYIGIGIVLIAALCQTRIPSTDGIRNGTLGEC